MCAPCEEIRRKVLDAIWAGKMAEAVKQAAIGIKEVIGGKV